MNEEMGGPAFRGPMRGNSRNDTGHKYPEGMTLWDWYAGHALAGYLASGPHDCSHEGIAHDAAITADAMLELRKKRMGSVGEA